MKLKQKINIRPFPAAMATLSLIAVVAVLQLSAAHTTKPVEALRLISSSPAGSVVPTESTSSVSPSASSAAKSAASASTGTVQPSPTAVAPTTSVSSSPSLTTTQPVLKAAPVPTSSISLYTNPNSSLAEAVLSYMATAGYDSGLQRMITTPMASWYGDWNTSVQSDVNSYVSAATASGQEPVLVAYDIPDRDCGGQSAGGASNASTYATWIDSFAAGIGNRRAIVVLEPDALAADCYTDARGAMLAAAVNELVSTTDASVYLDAGNSTWRTAAFMAPRLQQADIAQATGFSLNVSGFDTTSSSVSYGNSLSQLVGGKHYVIDTSRNGDGPTSDSQWCNPAGRSLGQTPSLQSGSALDAYLWIKSPGESDGSCGPTEAGTNAPAAGTFWPQYSLMLVRNAGW